MMLEGSVRRGSLGIAAAASFLLLVGCANPSINASKALALSGSKTATQLQASASAVYTGTLQIPKLERLNSAVTGSPASRPLPDEFGPIVASLKARVAAADALVAAYAAFGKLANYDARGQVDGALKNLAGEVNNLAAQVGEPPLSALAVEVVAISGGVVAGQAQAAALARANGAMIAILRKFQAAMSRQSESTAVIAISESLAGHRYNLSRVLWRRGLVSAQPLIDGVLVSEILETDPKLVYSSSNPRLTDVVDDILADERDQAQANVRKSYEASIAAVGGLVEAHESLARGGSIDLEGLLTMTNELATVAERLKTAAEADRKSVQG